MKDPTRLLDSSTGEAELRLLRAGANEEPPAGALQRLAAELGLPATANITPTAHATSTAATTSAAGSSATSHAATGTAAKLQLLALGAVAITLSAGVWFATRPAPTPQAISTTEHPSPPSAAAPSTPQPNGAAPSASQLAPAQPPAADIEAAPETLRLATHATRALAREIAQLDEVRRLLATDHPPAALVALGRYEREFPRGALLPEASVLRIEAHQRAGERERARALAERFLSEHPDSPHAARVRRLSGAGSHAR